MSDTILSGDITVYYDADNAQKRVEWTGSATGTRTVNELYSALQDLFDELAQMDDGSPMSAQTPTEYTIGIIDAGSINPWFIDPTTVEHLTGGAVKTSGWLRATGTNAGIVEVDCTNTDIVTGDIGFNISNASDTGVLLGILDTGGANTKLWIRPTDDTSTHDWDSTSGTITCNAHTAVQDAAGISAEMIWANLFSIGTIASNSHLYISQNNALLTAYEAVTDWWVDGQIDLLVLVSDMGGLVDGGFVEVFAQRYTATYDHFIVDASLGGRNPIPLATGVDGNNATGYRQFTGSSGSGTFLVGDVIEDDSDDTIQGVVTAVGGTVASPVLTYYLIGDPLNDFTGATGALTGTPSTAQCTAAAPSDVGPAALAGTTIVHASDQTQDIDEDTVNEDYSIVIDCSNELLADVYEWTKYINRRGETGTGDTDGQEGQFYIGSEVHITYTTETGTVAEGDTVTQAVTGATGVVVSHERTSNVVILRSTRGVFNTSDLIQETPASNELVGAHVIRIITPIKVAPYGTFAGGIWFCAPGVVLINVPGADANNYRLTDDGNNPVQAPTKVTATIANTRALDSLCMFRLDAPGGVIDKTEYTAAASTIFTNTLNVGTTITADTPLSGVVRLVGDDEDEEFRMRYSSFAGTAFTLDATLGLIADGGTTTTVIVDAAGSFNTNALPGDLLTNETAGGTAHILTVDSDTQITLTRAIAGQTTGDEYHINGLPITVDTSDNVYVPLIDIEEDTGTSGSPGSAEAIITYLGDVDVRVHVRQAGDIVPFATDGVITTNGLSISAIRTPDSIFT